MMIPTGSQGESHQPLHELSGASPLPATTVIQPRSRRGLYRFRLQTIALFTLVTSCWLAWCAYRHERFLDRVKACRRVISMGGTLSASHHKVISLPSGDVRIWEWLWPASYDIHVTAISFQQVPHTFMHPKLGTIQPDWSYESIAALGTEFAAFPELQSLSFDRSVLPRHSLRCVEQLTGLRHLDLSQTQITSADIEHLSGLTHLESLHLGRTRIDDDSLVHVRSMQKLRDLNLRSTRIGNAGIKHLLPLSRLEVLWLGNTRITDAALADIVQLPSLQELNLNPSQITDAGLVHLKSARPLTRLTLSSPFLTSAAVQRLQEELPHCEIQFYRDSSQ